MPAASAVALNDPCPVLSESTGRHRGSRCSRARQWIHAGHRGPLHPGDQPSSESCTPPIPARLKLVGSGAGICSFTGSISTVGVGGGASVATPD